MDKKDQLEQFVSDNREAFDNYEPSDSVWENLEADLPVVEDKKPIMVSLRKALFYGSAAVLVVAFGLVYLLNEAETEQMVEHSEPIENLDGYSLSDVSPELAEVEGYYVTQVSQSMERLEAMEVEPELLEEIELLDEEFRQLQLEMGESVNREQIVEAMIDNYRLKLEILETMLSEFETPEKTEEDEDIVI